MKTLKTLTLLAAIALGAAAPAGAGLYNITFNDGVGDRGSGLIDVESAESPNGNYYYAASSGFLDVTAGQAHGVWTLYTAGGSTTYPGFFTSNDGAFWYNNAVYPNGQNPDYPVTNPLLDLYGLLFTQNNGSVVNELNLWGNADGTYNLGGYVGGELTFNVTISLGGTTITPVPITPVPESPTIISGVLLLLPVAAGAFRSMRGKKSRQYSS